MKITIDTKEDSHEDIRKIVTLLSEMMNNKPSTPNNLFETQSSEMPGLMGMFDPPSQQPVTPSAQTPSLSAITTQKKEPEIEFY